MGFNFSAVGFKDVEAMVAAAAVPGHRARIGPSQRTAPTGQQRPRGSDSQCPAAATAPPSSTPARCDA